MRTMSYQWLHDGEDLVCVSNDTGPQEKFLFKTGMFGREYYFIERDISLKDYDEDAGAYCSEDIEWYVTWLSDVSKAGVGLSRNAVHVPVNTHADIKEVCLWCRIGCPEIKRTTSSAKSSVDWTLEMLEATSK